MSAPDKIIPAALAGTLMDELLLLEAAVSASEEWLRPILRQQVERIMHIVDTHQAS